MRTVLFNRVPRIQEKLPEGEVKVPGPPNFPPPPKLHWFQIVLPLFGIFVMLGVYVGVRGDWLLAIPMVAMSGTSIFGSIMTRKWQRKEHAKESAEKKALYEEALRIKTKELEDYHHQQQCILNEANPDRNTLVKWVQQHHPRLWSRRVEDEDFLMLRLGMGTLPSTIKVSVPESAMPDPALKPALALQEKYQYVPHVPILVDLHSGPVGVVGQLSDRLDVTRALLLNLLVHHAPDEVYVVAVYSSGRDAEWQWLKWLPHTHALDKNQDFVPLGNDVGSGKDMLDSLLEELHRRQSQLQDNYRHTSAHPWLVVLVENFPMVRDVPAIHLLLSDAGRKLNVTGIFMADREAEVPIGCRGIVQCHADNQTIYSQVETDRPRHFCSADRIDLKTMESVARSLAPLQVYTLLSDSDMPSYVRLLDQLHIRDVEQDDVLPRWNRHLDDEALKVPIGKRRGEQPLILDLNHTGHGPHGLVAGTTGSGKSELLQTMVVSLALNHHPYDLGFILVDFKGGGTFSELQYLPHTLGMVTDLDGSLTNRALVALEAEVERRKRLFQKAGVNDITPYQRLYWRAQERGDLDWGDPLPHLVIIVDEFAELVSDYPDFMEGLIAIARVGRSLGLHIILATQSPGGVVNQQIWANAKFRICLRVESRQESQDMLHRPEAANLPRIPGRGYLQVGNNDVFELFQVARVAGKYRSKVLKTGPLAPPEQGHVYVAEVTPLGTRKILFDSKSKKKNSGAQATRTDIDVVVERLQKVARQESIVSLPSPWPDPLSPDITLPELLAEQGYGGWDGGGWVLPRQIRITSLKMPSSCRTCGITLRGGAAFCGSCGTQVLARCSDCGHVVPVRELRCPGCKRPTSTEAAAEAPLPWLGAVLGMTDDPGNQRQFPTTFSLSEQDGHLVVFGAPGSGKETMVRTLIMSLASTHTPAEVNFYLLSFSGQVLQPFATLPHSGGVFTPLDKERVQRLMRLLLDELGERKELCNDHGVDSLEGLRKNSPLTTPPSLVVIVTGFAELRAHFSDELLQLTRLVREGGPYGIHLVLVGDRIGDIPSAIGSVVSRRMVFYMADSSEYSMALGAMLRVNKNESVPEGRGWYGRPPLVFQTARPSAARNDELGEIVDIQRIAAAMKQAWTGTRAKPVHLLESSIPLSTVFKELKEETSELTPAAAPIGLDYLRTQPVFVDLQRDGPHFLVAGSLQGGKTSLLWTWLLSLGMLHSPQQIQFLLMSGRRRSLAPLQNLPHVLAYSEAVDDFTDNVLAKLMDEVKRREDLQSRGQGGGWPVLLCCIDDYDEFSVDGGEDNQIQDDLVYLAKRGQDVSVHVVVTGPLPDMGVGGYNNKFLKEAKKGRSGLLVRLLDPNQNPWNMRLYGVDVNNMPSGRGYLVSNGVGTLMQVATPGDKGAVRTRVEQIAKRWANVAGVPAAAWPVVEEIEIEA